MSLAYTITHLALLHFRILPSFSPAALAQRRLSTASNKPPSSSVTLALMTLTSIYSLAWLAQASLCTACEMAPIAAGTQGNVPAWCPQSRFRDVPSTDRADRAAMLASLALVKDAINWVIFVAGLCMVECCRRGWMCARTMEMSADREGLVRAYDPGVAQSWSTKSTSGPAPTVAAYEMGSLPPPPIFADRKVKKNSYLGLRAVQTVPVNLGVPGVGYATRV
ncbi:uncharacterized protein HMPREF1541_01095 [Cyphellophora europaea CBS 101466]|uniref:Uncharacterized protein n=1 Tax=Cyphellophora europaea (strain CBS 101466) TaxID=1220924 RepID=W2SDW8_CYPE1|nr:uncharacterized protein HMPREF1541_01095 [Cyphellophora europaea CBS 101466]ETN46906.1 hypothetical protein HMPREF1541_01095 [Cyphellophora europaea CBS 101466]